MPLSSVTSFAGALNVNPFSESGPYVHRVARPRTSAKQHVTQIIQRIAGYARVAAGAGHQHVLPAGAEYPARRAPVQEYVSAHGPEQRLRRALSGDADPPRQDQGIARRPGCDLGPADSGPAGDGRYRPRQGVAAQHHLRPDPQYLYSAFGVRQISTIYMPANDYQVIMEAEPQYQKDPSP